MPKRIVIVCGEASGDRLGAGLVAKLKKQLPDCQIEGVGGPLLKAQGMECWFDAEQLSFMGFVDPILNIRSIYHIYRTIIRRCVDNPPDLFIGIDSPDFTLRCARKLRRHGIKTLHYVGPSVWAWRKNRIHGIKKAVDHMMVLFPFETAIYEAHQIPVTCVGMKLADDIPLTLSEGEINRAKQVAGINGSGPVMTLMGGSRRSELKYLIPIILKVMNCLLDKCPDIQFLIPCANETGKSIWITALEKTQYPVTVLVQKTKEAILSSDVVLAKSGTVTLETMLYKKPMVVFYKVSTINYWIGRFLLHIKQFSLPNLLANKELVKEHIQQIDPKVIASELFALLDNDQQALVSEFDRLHADLAKNADEAAANVALQLLK